MQGVGFRPFVYNLAHHHNFCGMVTNTGAGVIIHINTSDRYAKAFHKEILEKKPAVSTISSFEITEIPFVRYNSFTIVQSDKEAVITTPLTPDFAVCDDCLSEINDPQNRRFGYAFTTCVKCGPRYSVTTKFPFERENTSLDNFTMCKSCRSEYVDPQNRRFHSQTNSCPECGPSLSLTDNLGKVVSGQQDEVLTNCAKLIREGKIIAVKNTNGYLLCCDATNAKVIAELRKRKKRPAKPFAVLYPHLEAVRRDFKLSKMEVAELKSNVAPIVILENKDDPQIAVEAIAPDLNQTGVMLPSSALMALVMKYVGKPIVATSGNIHGSPIISTEKEAFDELKNVADYFVHHDLDIRFPQDDTVVRYIDGQHLIFRRSRGMAPNNLEHSIKSNATVLALGADLKATFTLLVNEQLYVSQYVGNLSEFSVSERFRSMTQQFLAMFRSKPTVVLTDKHSNYGSTLLGSEWATEWDAEQVKVQHHKAHFASVLGEHGLFNSIEKILGVIWDGTGLGDDGNVWGGEFFEYRNQSIGRVNHFEYYDWLANDKMAKEPRLALLCILEGNDREYIKDKFSETEWKIYERILAQNRLKTSSVGRLFDAVAALLNLTDSNTYESEAAMQVEKLANMYHGEEAVDYLLGESYELIPTSLLFRKLLKSFREGSSKKQIAFNFVFTLANTIITFAQKNNYSIVACSGGVFQNATLVRILIELAHKQQIDLRFNCKLSPNDENISFGQMMYHFYIK